MSFSDGYGVSPWLRKLGSGASGEGEHDAQAT